MSNQQWAYPTDEPDDQELVARVQNGDREAFAMLVNRHKRYVYNLAYRVLGNAADAEDAAQETFVRAYTHLGAYCPDKRFSVWLGAICSHWCIDILRMRGRRVQTVAIGKLAESDWFVSYAAEPEAEALARDARDEVHRWLAALPPQYQLILKLHYFQELSYNEIATTLGEPVSTVRMRLYRARALLQKTIVKEQDAPPLSPRPLRPRRALQQIAASA